VTDLPGYLDTRDRTDETTSEDRSELTKVEVRHLFGERRLGSAAAAATPAAEDGNHVCEQCDAVAERSDPDDPEDSRAVAEGDEHA
jgi:hypothetical protein